MIVPGESAVQGGGQIGYRLTRPPGGRMVRGMKHITYAEKSVLMGDEAADVLLEYAAALTTAGRGDKVDVYAQSADGDEIVASFVLGDGVSIMAETTTSTAPEPDNSEAVAYMRRQMAEISATRRAVPMDGADAEIENIEDEFQLGL